MCDIGGCQAASVGDEDRPAVWNIILWPCLH